MQYLYLFYVLDADESYDDIFILRGVVSTLMWRVSFFSHSTCISANQSLPGNISLIMYTMLTRRLCDFYHNVGSTGEVQPKGKHKESVVVVVIPAQKFIFDIDCDTSSYHLQIL